MASRQSVLGHCLLSPFSQGQERQEKLFFRRNTEIMCQLFHPQLEDRLGHKALRSWSELGPTRDGYSSHDVINIPWARHGARSLSQSTYNDDDKIRPYTVSPVSMISKSKRTHSASSVYVPKSLKPHTISSISVLKSFRPHTTSSVSVSKSFQRRANRSLSYSKPFILQDYHHHFIKNSGDSFNDKSSQNKSKNSGLHNKKRSDEESDGEENDDASSCRDMTSPSRHEMLLESQRHPPSVHCDTLGPTSCRHCTRRISLSGATFLLPGTGVISSGQSTVRIHPSQMEKMTPTPMSSQHPNIPRTTTIAAPPELHTPISVFLRTRKKKSDQIETPVDATSMIIPSSVKTLGKHEGRQCISSHNAVTNQNQEDLEDLVDDDDQVEDEDTDLADGAAFDGLRVRVTFKEKLVEDG